MEDKVICWWGAVVDYDGCDVPAVAGDAKDRGVVSEYGIFGADRFILRYGNLPTDTVLCYRICGAAWPMVIPEFV